MNNIRLKILRYRIEKEKDYDKQLKLAIKYLKIKRKQLENA